MANENERPPLQYRGDADYVLRKGHDVLWVTVDNLSVYLRRTDEGVAVDIYPLDGEMDDSLAGCWALFSENEEQ